MIFNKFITLNPFFVAIKLVELYNPFESFNLIKFNILLKINWLYNFLESYNNQ